jgi:hypothetical protein
LPAGGGGGGFAPPLAFVVVMVLSAPPPPPLQRECRVVTLAMHITSKMRTYERRGHKISPSASVD